MLIKRGWVILMSGKDLCSKQSRSIATSGFENVFTQRHVNEYQQKGATLVENVLTNQEVDNLIEYTKEMVNKNDIYKKKVVFQSGKDNRGLDFITTGDKIHFFFEDNVLDSQGNLLVPKEHALNKIGHAMHDLDPFYQKFSYQPLYKYILQHIGYVAPTLVQSMYIYKNPKVGSQVQAHTDNTYLITEPHLSCVGFWFALHDATIENGCLWGVSGSQKKATTRFFYLNEKRDNVFYEGEEKEYDIQKMEPLEVKKGSMLVFHGDYVHQSDHNHSAQPRHALTFHFVETKGVNWHNRNWLQRNKDLPFRDYNKEVPQNV